MSRKELIQMIINYCEKCGSKFMTTYVPHEACPECEDQWNNSEEITL